jgi:hypothetical protein
MWLVRFRFAKLAAHVDQGQIKSITLFISWNVFMITFSIFIPASDKHYTCFYVKFWTIWTKRNIALPYLYSILHLY